MMINLAIMMINLGILIIKGLYRSKDYDEQKNWGFFCFINFPIFPGVMGCSAAEATGLGFVCFVVINPRVFSANRVDLGFFLFHIFSNFPPPPQSDLKTPLEALNVQFQNFLAMVETTVDLQEVRGGGGEEEEEWSFSVSGWDGISLIGWWLKPRT